MTKYGLTQGLKKTNQPLTFMLPRSCDHTVIPQLAVCFGAEQMMHRSLLLCLLLLFVCQGHEIENRFLEGKIVQAGTLGWWKFQMALLTGLRAGVG